MGDLCLYLGITLAGYLLGSQIRGLKEKLNGIGKIQTLSIFCVVTMMGMRMGANEEITQHLSSIGFTALIITIFTLVFSIGGIYTVRKLMGIDRYGRFKNKDFPKEVDSDNVIENKKDAEEKQGFDVMTFVIVIAVLAGMLTGYFWIRDAFADNMTAFESGIQLGIKIGLCILLIFVGIDLGLEGTVVDNFRKVGWRVFVFPLVVVVSTLLGSGISGVFMGLSLKESLAIGAGFGWYSLAPGMIMEAGLITASAVSFLHNVLRELFSILFIPRVARKVGYIETTGMPGAAAMDVCLPIVEKSTRSEIAVYSFISGVLLSILVPVLVPFILAL